MAELGSDLNELKSYVSKEIGSDICKDEESGITDCLKVTNISATKGVTTWHEDSSQKSWKCGHTATSFSFL